ncbi:duodenase-1-like [Plectropomus leopardus]|uniref:duodenase-1-like n=1 Tax=Plectropomus leopardus TaxID=160734 RepID=UPI001C4CFC67|nr:duodenase-1-like [Plectropomus leopardus]
MLTHRELVILILALTLDCYVRTGEIVGGKEVKPHSKPYMVLLEQHMEDGRAKNCDGFLLNEDFVMTAAHCKAWSSFALLGVHNARNISGTQRISVKTPFPHEDYREEDYENDIMLLKLSSKANLTENVRPITLASKADGSPKMCSVFGWGRKDRNVKNRSPILNGVNVTLADNEKCDIDKTYCSVEVVGPAQGDSGGPLVCEDGKAHGVVSSNTLLSAEQEIYIHRYTKISAYTSWIDQIMEQQGKSYM